MKIEYSIESFETFIFDRNWIEPPLFYNNPSKVLRFNLISQPECESYKLLCNSFDDVFAIGSDVYIVFYGTKDRSWKGGKHYFKPFSFKKLLRKSYESRDDDLRDENPYIVLCKSRKEAVKRTKYFVEYLRGEQNSCMVFISRKKSVALHYYDNRGFDLQCEDVDFLKLMQNRYSAYLIDIKQS